MSFTRDLYDGETHLNFVRSWKIGVPLSIAAMVISALAIGVWGLNLGIDFEGGTAWELPSNGVEVSEVRDALAPYGADNAKVQILGGDTLRVSSDVQADTGVDDVNEEVTAVLVETAGVAEGDVRVSRVAGTWSVPVGEEVTTETLETALSDAGIESVVQIDEGVAKVQAATNILDITNALAEVTGVDPSEVSVSNVGPSWGKSLTSQALRALVAFFVIIAIYLAIRLEWKMSVGALASVVHDLLVTVGVYAIFRFEVTPATVISFLTILGYSLYDTIVVFDRVRENAPKTSVAGKMTYTQMMNMSLNQVFPRSFNATISAIIPVASLLVIGSFIYGAVTLQEFALALFVGLLVGAYSSLYIASPVVAWIKEREPRNRQIRERLAARDEALGGTASGPIDEPIAATVAAPAPSPAGREPASSGTASGTGRPANWSGNHPPRPRKKRKK